ncbi:fimbria/pilus periplasmic chaperone, partial [Photobacterium damselae]|uniref:fimbria/pilus periplasmic chaperone n=1 Tax=Photobacterium damselae TaxID=38293 RepID=UPI002F402B63
IYDESKKNISLEVRNNSKEGYGGQVWIEHISQSKSDPAFIPLPSFFKVGGEQTQIVRIMKITESLPNDKESIFWLNVQEIPPVSDSESNVMVVAVNTKVKLIYRPEQIKNERLNAESLLIVEKNGNQLVLKNPTPYYFAAVDLKINGIQKVKLNKGLMNKIGMIEPFSSITLTGLNADKGDSMTIDTIDDYGAINSYKISIK